MRHSWIKTLLDHLPFDPRYIRLNIHSCDLSRFSGEYVRLNWVRYILSIRAVTKGAFILTILGKAQLPSPLAWALCPAVSKLPGVMFDFFSSKYLFSLNAYIPMTKTCSVTSVYELINEADVSDLERTYHIFGNSFSQLCKSCINITSAGGILKAGWNLVVPFRIQCW